MTADLLNLNPHAIRQILAAMNTRERNVLCTHNSQFSSRAHNVDSSKQRHIGLQKQLLLNNQMHTGIPMATSWALTTPHVYNRYRTIDHQGGFKRVLFAL